MTSGLEAWHFWSLPGNATTYNSQQLGNRYRAVLVTVTNIQKVVSFAIFYFFRSLFPSVCLGTLQFITARQSISSSLGDSDARSESRQIYYFTKIFHPMLSSVCLGTQ